MKKSLEMLDELRKRGVKIAKFQDGEVFEVEFFGDAPPPAEAEGTATIPAEASDVAEDYEAALKQLRTRRFGEKGAA